MRIALVLGTRPQLVKSVPIIREAVRRNYDLGIVHTGQHYDIEMSDVFFRIFSIPRPAANLGVGSGSEGYQTGEIIIRLEKFLSRDSPRLVVVPGDTNSALSGAIASMKLRIPVAHVEAGARSFNMKMQEEMNRRAIDHVSDELFAVSPACVSHLEEERVQGRVIPSGDTMFEIYRDSAEPIERSDILEKVGVSPMDYFVATIHRAEITNDLELLLRTLRALNSVGKNVVFPAHPRTQNALRANGLGISGDNLKVIKPVDYFSMMKLVKNSVALFTDSGGLQKEAFWSKTPCVTLRNETEWTETVELGVNIVMGADVVDKLPTIAQEIVSNRDAYEEKFSSAINPYAVSGHPASQIVADELRSYAE